MTRFARISFILLSYSTFALFSAGPISAQEKLSGSNLDVRTVLAFKVSDAAVQKLLPEG